MSEMSIEDDFAEAEAMLRAEEEAAARGEAVEAVAPPPPPEDEKVVCPEAKDGSVWIIRPCDVDWDSHVNVNDREMASIRRDAFHNMTDKVIVKITSQNEELIGINVYPILDSDEKDHTKAFSLFAIMKKMQFTSVFSEQSTPDKFSEASRIHQIHWEEYRKELREAKRKAEAEAKRKKEEEEKKALNEIEITRGKWAELLDLLYPDNWDIDAQNRLIIKFPE